MTYNKVSQSSQIRRSHFHREGSINTRRYSKVIAGLGSGLMLLVMVGTSAMAAGGGTTRLSLASDGTQANGGSVTPSISADGRYVAFISSASNLVVGDTNGQSDVFVRDLQSGNIELISKSSGGTQANGNSTGAAISANGNFVVYTSSASNLVPGDLNNVADVFLFDRQTKMTKRVSVASDGTEANNASSSPTISGDGRFIAFRSKASNLRSGCANCTEEIFLHDQQTRTTQEISYLGYYDGAKKAVRPSISEDGRFIAYDGGYYGFTAYTDVFIFNRQTSSTQKIPDPSGLCSPYLCDYKMVPAISADGRYVLYLLNVNNNFIDYLYLYDQQTSSNEPVLSNIDGSPMGGSFDPISITADGRYVVFSAYGKNLVPGYTTDNTTNIFVRDMQLGVNELVSIAYDWTPANNGDFQGPCSCITQDLRFVVFNSSASNLVPDDTNNADDIFIHDRQAEQAFFSLSGHIQDGIHNNLSGVSVSDGSGHAATTDSIGNYTLSGLEAGTYTITPTKDGLFFTPPTREVVVSGDMEVNFTGYPCIAPSGLNVCNLEPGDILLERSPTYAAIFSIGGTYFTHAALYLGEVAAPGGGAETIMPRLAEGQGYTDAVQDQVWETALTSHPFWSGNNLLDWAVIRPNITATVKKVAIQYSRDKAAAEGVTFDIWASKWTNDKFYCSKLVWRSYLDVPGGNDLEVNVGVGSALLDWWVTPDDLFFSVLKGSTIVESKLGITLDRILLTLWSPAHIMLIDPSGLRTGFDPDTGTILNEIPLATYTAPPDAEVETITAIGVGEGWKVVVTGYDNGEYKLEYHYLEAGTLNIVKSDTTAPAQVDQYDIEDPMFGIYLPLINR